MSIHVPAGETREVGGLAEGYRIRVAGGPVYLGHNHGEVSNGNVVRYPIGYGFTIDHLRRKPVYAHAPQTDATLEVDTDGFSVRETVQEIFGVEDSNQTPQTVYQDQTRRSAESVEEVNADQTQTISANGDQTTTVTAASGEVWLLRGWLFEWRPNADWSGASDDTIVITVETESEGVELGRLEQTDTDSSSGIDYKSGEWIVGGTLTDSRNDVLRGHKIDDTNGLNVVVDNQSPNNDMETTRKIRFEFEVLRT